MKLIMGSDHGGFPLKEYLKKQLTTWGVAYEDVGPFSFEPGDDYPVFAEKVAKKVAATKNIGLLICGNGQGICIAANKVKGIRAVVCYDEYTAVTSRNDDNANIICLRGRKFSKSKAAKVLKVWLGTPFSGEARHLRRLTMVRKIENG